MSQKPVCSRNLWHCRALQCWACPGEAHTDLSLRNTRDEQLGRPQGCCPSLYNAQESLGPHRPETTRTTPGLEVFIWNESGMAHVRGGYGIGSRRMEEGRRRKVGCCISRILSQKCLASGITLRHTGVPGQECEAVFSCVPVLISNAPVCHSQPPGCTWVWV